MMYPSSAWPSDIHLPSASVGPPNAPGDYVDASDFVPEPYSIFCIRWQPKESTNKANALTRIPGDHMFFLFKQSETHPPRSVSPRDTSDPPPLEPELLLSNECCADEAAYVRESHFPSSVILPLPGMSFRAPQLMLDPPTSARSRRLDADFPFLPFN